MSRRKSFTKKTKKESKKPKTADEISLLEFEDFDDFDLRYIEDDLDDLSIEDDLSESPQEKTSFTKKPKLEEKDSDESVSDIVEEPSGTKSLFTVVRENLIESQRECYVHRLIYIGDHNFPCDEFEGIEVKFKENIDIVNESDNEELLSGYLLHYSNYFCHVLDGSEEALNEHLSLLFNSTDMMQYLGRMKLLVAYHHINQRFLENWIDIKGKPPTLLDKIESDADTLANMTICIQKLYKLGKNIRTNRGAPSTSICVNPFQIHSEFSAIRSKSIVSNTNIFGKSSDTLPEYQILEFLLANDEIQDLREYFKSYEGSALVHNYHDETWPVSAELVPGDVYEKDYQLPDDYPENLEYEKKSVD